MEYIDGLDLGQVLSEYAIKGELMPQTDVVRIGRAIASALDYAHARGVVHRDVKPSNVLVAQDGRIVLTDFGLALDTQQGSVGEVFGTAHYIAPEQARRSSEALPQSDLYSLGIMLYEMLTGSVPFDDPSPTSVALQHIMEPPPAPRSINPKLNEETEAVLLKALSKATQDRYQSGNLLMDALEHALQQEKPRAVSLLLPPVPAGMGQTEPPQSPKDTSQAAASSLPQTPATEHRPIQESPAPKKSLPIPWIVFGGCSLVFVALLAVAGLLFANPLAVLFQTGSMPPPKSPVSPTEAQPSQIAESTSENTPGKSETPITSVVETPTTQPQTALASPTILYPDGKQFTLFYDNNSLYFLNLSESDIPINWIAFERLSNGGVASNRFNGSRWGQFYGTSTPTWCMAIEILDSSPYLKPSECGHNKKYLSLRTPVRDDATVFWTTQENSHQFRVLWRESGKDTEVARCEINVGTCEVFLP
jgi:serine/threonine protein kinase